MTKPRDEDAADDLGPELNAPDPMPHAHPPEPRAHDPRVMGVVMEGKSDGQRTPVKPRG